MAGDVAPAPETPAGKGMDESISIPALTSMGTRPSRRDVLKAMLSGSSTLRVLSLNLGGRNTNPLEFELKGDSSEIAGKSMAMLRRATKALEEVREGPSSMPAAERRLVSRILAGIYQDAADSEWHTQIEELFQCQTWKRVLSRVANQQPHLFNALNLCTLKMRRPSVWEDPASCVELQSVHDFLLAWEQWYFELDRQSDFWLEEAPHNAEKRNLDLATGFAGLLLFDVMCVCCARCALGDEAEGGFCQDGREVPFRRIATAAFQLPASSLHSRHRKAEKFVRSMGVHVLFAQEAREFADNEGIAEAFLPPFCSLDGFTAVFLRRGVFTNTIDISAPVQARMKELQDLLDTKKELGKAWHTTSNRLAAVRCTYQSQAGGFQVCLVSLHCSQSSTTVTFIETLRDVLADYDAEVYIVGMDSNCSGKDAAALQRSLRNSGFEIGRQQDQVTVVKQRTNFQTQVKKAGETDISHKDYVVSWGCTRLLRGATVYTPDLRTAYGVEQETKRCVRLPTTQWPFDHCSVATSFKPKKRYTRSSIFQAAAFCFAGLVALAVLATLTALLGWTHRNPYGPPGIWLQDNFPGTSRVGICEAAAPCLAGWEERVGSCYKASPRLPYNDAEGFCHQRESILVSIGSEEENRFLTERLCPAGEFCWIGLRSDTSRVKYWWASGESVGYTNLVGAQGRLFPLFPLSRDTEREVAVLSALPEEISGCRNLEFLPTSLAELPEALMAIRLLGAALTVGVSTVLLLLPRPAQLMTTLYLLAAFVLHFAFYLASSYSYCFAGEIGALGFAVSSASLIDGLFRQVISLWAFWIILKRVSLLWPSRFPRVIFMLLIISMFIGSVIFVLFIDSATSLCPSCAVVVSVLVLLGIFILLYLLFIAPIGFNLYRTWAVMTEEAATGRSKEGGSRLRSQVHSAQIHFFVVSMAIITGAIRWCVFLAWMVEATRAHPVLWVRFLMPICSYADSMANDICSYVLVVLNIDEVVARAKGITAEVARRAAQEVDQHQLAVRLLKAAPTSQEQLAHLALLESRAREVARAAEDQQEQQQQQHPQEQPYGVLKAAVQAESSRIHRLMWCVRVRDMTMPLRYQYLIDIQPLHHAPQQHVPERFAALPEGSPLEEGKAADVASRYFDWLYAQADGAQQVLFHQVKQLVTSFNRTPWPSDLGLASEQFPWSIWPHGPHNVAPQQFRSMEMEAVSPGRILLHRPPGVACLGSGHQSSALTHCFVMEEESPSSVRIHRSGAEAPEKVPREELRKCSGGAVFVPGPKKRRQRCLDKIEVDYEGKEVWPAAASLLDICRCMILLEDPYAIAVLVAYIRNNMQVVRLKNRFGEDTLQHLHPEELQSVFYNAAEVLDSRTPHTPSDGRMPHTPADSRTSHTFSGDVAGDRQYRDIAINVVVPSPGGVPFICEIQVTLSNLAILKKADTKLYTIRRMQSPHELRTTYVFVEADSEGEG